MTRPLPSARPDEIGLSGDHLERLASALQSRIDRGHIPGAVALIARNGKVGFHRAFGRRDPAASDAMAEDAIFRIYSMTKPIVSVAVMMLLEEGAFLLSDPISAFIPAFKDMQVLRERDGRAEHVAAERAITVQDLLRHTSGLTYEFRGSGAVQRAYMDAKVYRRGQTNADQAAMLAKLPLMYQPGTRWEYSRSTDVLGRLVEVVSGRSLGDFIRERILEPLGMEDSGFQVPSESHGRLAGGFAKDPETGADVTLIEVRERPSFESGGGGMVSAAMDYARFMQMLLNGGALHGERLLGPRTVAWMTADHLGAIPGSPDILPPGHGFGLGFAVRRAPGLAPFPGSVGTYFWGGAAGTTFWVDPVERLTAVLMIQAPGQREHYRVLFRDLAYAAIAD